MSFCKSKLAAFLLAFSLMTGCSIEYFESKTKIGSSDYSYVDQGGYQKYLVKKAEQETIEIEPYILGYFDYLNSYYFVRQVVSSVDCVDRGIETEVRSDKEYWLLPKGRDQVLNGPLSMAALLKVLGDSGINSDDISKILEKIRTLEKAHSMIDRKVSTGCTEGIQKQ